MLLKSWEKLPEELKNNHVKYYYDILQKKRISLIIKRIFDLLLSIILLVVFLPLFFAIAVSIKLDSKGPIIFKQIRVTQYGREFKIFKFRTMMHNADKMGSIVTTKNDFRITRIGRILRKFRLDEIPQLINIIRGEMSFVGTRPEAVKYVKMYTDEMKATLLLPAGVTSEASIHFKDEEKLLTDVENIDDIYINKILKEKMKYNLKSIENYSILNDFKTIFKTIIVIFKKNVAINNEICKKKDCKSN